MQKNGWCPRVDAMVSGLSPRKIRLATGSLRRSFFTLGRLLALASRQQSMALLPRSAGRREQEHGTQPLLLDQPSDPGWPRQESCRSAAPPWRLDQPRAARLSLRLGTPTGRILPSSPAWVRPQGGYRGGARNGTNVLSRRGPPGKETSGGQGQRGVDA